MRNSVEIAQYIKKIRERKGLSAVELANRVGVTKGTISRYESGTRKIPMDDIPKFASVLDISPVDILIESGDEPVDINSTEYPYYPIGISAGLPLCIDSIDENNMEYISIPDNLMGKWAGRKDIFMMRVNGDSMNKVVPHGSLIAVKPVKISDLTNGDIVVYSDGGDYAVKRFYQRETKIIFRPDSTDDMFSDYETTTDNSDLIIHGKVVLYLVELD
ncbi:MULTISPECIES: LexA family protein [Bacillus]|uniref:LexA family protein n=1 Tax=Bacillus TaxID=1386 RepID=UPI00119EA007|nr:MULTISPECIES: LexA family transcriptional regulator [Bacillus subtilis group]MEC2220898.1 S24 family peptidase [Bacillus subtilis]TWM24608.1 LexA repressor [Bacillus licheniformis]